MKFRDFLRYMSNASSSVKRLRFSVILQPRILSTIRRLWNEAFYMVEDGARCAPSLPRVMRCVLLHPPPCKTLHVTTSVHQFKGECDMKRFKWWRMEQDAHHLSHALCGAFSSILHHVERFMSQPPNGSNPFIIPPSTIIHNRVSGVLNNFSPGDFPLQFAFCFHDDVQRNSA